MSKKTIGKLEHLRQLALLKEEMALDEEEETPTQEFALKNIVDIARSYIGSLFSTSPKEETHNVSLVKQPPVVNLVHKQTDPEFQKHTKVMRCMIDTFHMKTIRMMEAHLLKSRAEIVALLRQTHPEINEEGSSDTVTIRQLVEIEPGKKILVTGSFKRNPASQQIVMPIIESVNLQ